MIEFISNYGLFLLKTATIVIAILIILAAIVSATSKNKGRNKGQLKIKKLNKYFDELRDQLRNSLLSKGELKALHKQDKKEEKAKAEKKKASERKRMFVLDFDGDIRASAVSHLRQEITALLTIANKDDEIMVRLTSPGGMIPHYGLAASQLQRIRQREIPLTIAVDKVAASGGYMMACVANKIIAAPFAIIGSIGVLAQIPNFHRLLEKHHVEFEQLTAGEYKRTLTMFGKNTKEARGKMQEELEETHELFKDFITQNRNQIDIHQVATGEHWFASKAKEFNLIDDLQTSDDYLLQASNHRDVYHLSYHKHKSLAKRFSHSAQTLLDQLLIRHK